MATPHRTILAGYGLPLSEAPATLPYRQPKVPRFAAAMAARRQAATRGTTVPSGRGVLPLPPAAAPRKPPTRIRPSPLQTSDNPRDIMEVIAQYARARRLVTITYRKKTDQNKIITRTCEPYSIRVKITKSGSNRYFYGYCLPHNEIHSFIIANIVSVVGTNRRFVPRWQVELG